MRMIVAVRARCQDEHANGKDADTKRYSDMVLLQ